jgi:hypothetical protein
MPESPGRFQQLEKRSRDEGGSGRVTGAISDIHLEKHGRAAEQYRSAQTER